MANIDIYKRLTSHFSLALTVSEILTVWMFYLEKVGQGQGIQLSQWRHLMANIKIFKRHPYIFYFHQNTTYNHDSNRQTHTAMDKLPTIGEILQISPTDVAKMPAFSMVSCLLDYANSVLPGVHKNGEGRSSGGDRRGEGQYWKPRWIWSVRIVVNRYRSMSNGLKASFVIR